MVMSNYQNIIFHQLESYFKNILKITKDEFKITSNLIKSVILIITHNHHKGLGENNER